MSFSDNARKACIRNNWNTPLLRHFYNAWGKPYCYLGLPGPKAIDVKLWSDMIGRVIAFQMENEGREPREDLTSLGRELAILKFSSRISNIVYCGPLEEVILQGYDHDGKHFSSEDFVTLYNLDFCNAITGKVNVNGKPKLLRFEAIRKAISLQRAVFRSTGESRFIMLITMNDSFHVKPVLKALGSKDLPQATRQFLSSLPPSAKPKRATILTKNKTEYLKAFVFTFLRYLFDGQNVGSFFLPPVSYIGNTANSPMLHFLVVCEMAGEEEAHPHERQTASDFFRLGTLTATERTIKHKNGRGFGSPVVLVQNAGFA